jgi:hypothetical protein
MNSDPSRRETYPLRVVIDAHLVVAHESVIGHFRELGKSWQPVHEALVNPSAMIRTHDVGYA